MKPNRYRIIFFSEENICGNFRTVERSTKWMTQEELALAWEKYKYKGGRIAKQTNEEN